jgi:hypothetical protein
MRRPLLQNNDARSLQQHDPSSVAWFELWHCRKNLIRSLADWHANQVEPVGSPRRIAADQNNTPFCRAHGGEALALLASEDKFAACQQLRRAG